MMEQESLETLAEETSDTVTRAQWLVHYLRRFRQWGSMFAGDTQAAVESKTLRDILEQIYSRQDTLDSLLHQQQQVDHLAGLYPVEGVEFDGKPYRCYAEAAYKAASEICLMLYISHPDARLCHPSLARSPGEPFPQMDITRMIKNNWAGMRDSALPTARQLEQLQVLLFAEERKVGKEIQSAAKAGHGQTVEINPAVQFSKADLSRVSAFVATLKAGLKTGMEFISKHDGNVALKDLAFEMDWDTESHDDSWGSFSQRVNQKWLAHRYVENVSYALKRVNNCATIKKSLTRKRGKKQGAANATPPKRRNSKKT